MVKDLIIQIDTYQTVLHNVPIIPLKDVDLILGREWLSSIPKPDIDWTSGVVRFEINGDSHVFNPIPDNSVRCQALQLKKFSKFCRQRNVDIVLAMVRQVDPKLNTVKAAVAGTNALDEVSDPQIRDLLREFNDV